MRYLRRIRWGVAALSLALTSMFFLDLANLVPPFFISTTLSLQAGPALIHALSLSGLAVAGLVVVLAATIVAGRVYCSHLCPLGTLQDIFIWSAKRNFKHRKYPYAKPHYALHYAITVLLIISAFCGSFFLLNLFEPFSSFGRILSNIVRPLVILLNNAAAFVLTKRQIFFLYEIPLKGLSVSVVAATLFFFGGLFWLSYFHGRYFCNTLCPVGGVLSLISRFSLFRITIDNEHCIDCGLCERVCRARCIDSEKREIDFAACVGCFDCVSSCPTVGMKYSFGKIKSHAQTPPDDGRRGILAAASSGMLWLIAVKQPASRSVEPTYEQTRKTPVVAPGGRSIERFTSHCTACHLCVSTCPTHVLQPSFFEFGLAGVMQPRMDYSVSYCNFDCTSLRAGLPDRGNSANPPRREEITANRQNALCQRGLHRRDEENRLRRMFRALPDESCEDGACTGKLSIPEVDNQYCIGCGACEHACPATPRKAIFVQSNAVHGIAKKREELKLAPPVSSPQDFPF